MRISTDLQLSKDGADGEKVEVLEYPEYSKYAHNPKKSYKDDISIPGIHVIAVVDKGASPGALRTKWGIYLANNSVSSFS